MIRAVLAVAIAICLAVPGFAATEIQEVTSPGGFKAWLVEEGAVPFTALELRFTGGASLDRAGKRGAINLMTATLEEGAGDLDAQAFSIARDDLAASIRFGVSQDALSISARFLTENREEAIALIKLALTDPRFDQEAIDRVRRQIVSTLRADETNAYVMAGQTFNAQVFGDHPYGSSPDGTVDSVEALTRDDLVQAFNDVVVADRVFVGAAGDISAEELANLMDELLGDLPSGGAPLPSAAKTRFSGGVTLVQHDVPQSVVLFGHGGLPRDDPDFFPAFVLNEVFGGAGQQSRLSLEVRNKRGLTYGIGSHIVNSDHADLVMGQFASANDRVAEAIEVVKQQWSLVVEEGITAEELEAAKTYLTGAYPLLFDSNASIAQILVGMQQDGRPIDYIQKRNSMIEAVTLEDVRRVARRLYKPDDLRFVVVGQPDDLEPSD